MLWCGMPNAEREGTMGQRGGTEIGERAKALRHRATKGLRDGSDRIRRLPASGTEGSAAGDEDRRLTAPLAASCQGTCRGRLDRIEINCSGRTIHRWRFMSSPVIQIEAPPLRVDGSGAIRVGGSRVLLELVVRAFQDGATPEAIAQRYPSASLADIYAAVTYYLRHRDDVERYLVERERVAHEVRQRIEARQGDLSAVRARLLSART